MWSALAKLTEGIAVWGFGGCVSEAYRRYRCFGSFGSAIAVLGVWGCDRVLGGLEVR
ncbi:MAG: hypothetical protein F6K62_05440 [Sphaerospermopsis sp. SIO1G2]|nr:hypothetical protein [Sphaerospermopsis sp. SIO1G2]